MIEGTNFVSSVILFLLSLGLLLFPPAKKNGYYGYRTPQAFKSPENWKLAQRVSSILLLVMSISVMMVSVYANLNSVYFHEFWHGLLPGLALTILVTELWLWKFGTKSK